MLVTLIRKKDMKITHEFMPGGYYMFESLASGRSCYFESKEEAEIFKCLLKRYLIKYVQINKLYLSSEGFQILLRVRTKETIIKHYRDGRKKQGKECRKGFIKSPWRIISEQMRKFMSLYVRAVNKIRGREGVLVKQRYQRYYFESEVEYTLSLIHISEPTRPY